MPKTVIVPLDGSQFAERAIPVARTFATQTEGHVELLSVRWDDKRSEALLYLQRTAEAEGPAEIMLIRDRHAAEAITLAAQENDDCIVCMTSHGQRRLAVVGPRQRCRGCHPRGSPSGASRRASLQD